MKKLFLNKGKDESLRRYHPWVFSGAVHHIEGNPQEGELVEVYTINNEFLAIGHWQIGSIAVRMLTFDDTAIDEAFFEQYSHIWRRLDIIESEFNLIARDEHPLGYLRTNVTLQQFDRFYETFGVIEGDGMYLAPKDRVNVW